MQLSAINMSTHLILSIGKGVRTLVRQQINSRDGRTYLVFGNGQYMRGEFEMGHSQVAREARRIKRRNRLAAVKSATKG